MISVKNLNYTYQGGTAKAVEAVNFSVAKGEIFGFLGPSGAGKTTTQNILIRLLKGYEGQIQVKGKDLTGYDSAYFEKVGVCFELPNHYSRLTALQNLEFFKSMYQGPTEDPRHLLEIVGLADDEQVKVANFSKGMKMRLNFVRSLLNQPELLFLDEPTSGLDPVNARNIKDIILEKKAQGTTTFLTTHNMHDAEELCDRVAFILDGKIAVIDTPRNLKLKHGKRSVIVEHNNSGQLKKAEFPLDGLGVNGEFLDLLKTGAVETIHTQETTLEEVFIKVTGRSLS